MICTKCGQDKLDKEFYGRPSRPKGLVSYCKLCFTEMRRFYRSERKSILAEIKLKRGCVDCGFNKSAAALHFDHRNPQIKNFSIARDESNKAWKKVLEEVEKCDVRCANCHAIRHANEKRRSGEMVDATVC